MKKAHRSKRKMTYHGRSGYPVIHYTEDDRSYIMVRKKGGGTRRLYLKNGQVPQKQRGGGGNVGKKKRGKKKKKWGSIGAPHSAKRKRHMAKIRRKR